MGFCRMGDITISIDVNVQTGTCCVHMQYQDASCSRSPLTSNISLSYPRLGANDEVSRL